LLGATSPPVAIFAVALLTPLARLTRTSRPRGQVRTVMEMGYEREQAESALAAAGGEVAGAVEWLLSAEAHAGSDARSTPQLQVQAVALEAKARELKPSNPDAIPARLLRDSYGVHPHAAATAATLTLATGGMPPPLVGLLNAKVRKTPSCPRSWANFSLL
jgi:hypothetical protein